MKRLLVLCLSSIWSVSCSLPPAAVQSPSAVTAKVTENITTSQSLGDQSLIQKIVLPSGILLPSGLDEPDVPLPPGRGTAVISSDQQTLQQLDKNLPARLSMAGATQQELAATVSDETQTLVKTKLNELQQQRMQSLGKANISGRIELPNEMILPSGLTVPSGLANAAALRIQQTTPATLLWTIQAIGPSGLVLAETQVQADGHYQLSQLPSGHRVLLKASHPRFPQFEVMGFVDIPPVPSGQSKSYQQPLTPTTTALLRLLRSAQQTGDLEVDRIPIEQAQTMFAPEIKKLADWLQIYLNHPMIETLEKQGMTTAWQEWLELRWRQQVLLVREMALSLRKNLKKSQNTPKLDSQIITNPVEVLMPTVNFSTASTAAQPVLQVAWLNPLRNFKTTTEDN